MKKSISLLILMLLYLYAVDASIGVKNKQKYSFAKSKYIDCGSIELNEKINEDENIDESILVINLTSHLDKHYPYLNNTTTKLSFSTHLSQQVNKTFSEHFKLDLNSGLVFLTKSIDRESICTSRSSKRKRVITRHLSQKNFLSNNNYIYLWLQLHKIISVPSIVNICHNN